MSSSPTSIAELSRGAVATPTLAADCTGVTGGALRICTATDPLSEKDDAPFETADFVPFGPVDFKEGRGNSEVMAVSIAERGETSGPDFTVEGVVAFGGACGATDAAGLREGAGLPPCNGEVARPLWGVDGEVYGDGTTLASALLAVPGRAGRVAAGARRIAPLAERPSLVMEAFTSPRNSCICCCNCMVVAA